MVAKTERQHKSVTRKSNVVLALDDTLADMEELLGHFERLHYDAWVMDVELWGMLLTEWRQRLIIPASRKVVAS